MKASLHLALWLFVIVAELLLMAAFTTPDRVQARLDVEVANARWAFGDRATDAMIARANDLFADHFTTPMRKSEDRLYARRAPGEPPLMPLAITGKTNNMLLVFWMLVYQMLWRLQVMALWLWPMLGVVAAACVDGYTQWRRKYYNFAYSNPLIYNTAMHWMIVLFFLPFVYLVGPLPMSPLFMPFWTLVMIWPLMLAIANFQKMID